MRTTFGLGGLLALCLLACDKSDPASTADASPAMPSASAPAAAPPPSASAATAPSASAASAAPAPKCSPGFTGNALPAYCIKIPATYTLMVSYDTTSLAEQAKDVESELKFGGDKLEKKGDLPGGNKWFQGSHQDYARIIALIKGSGSLVLKCSF